MPIKRLTLASLALALSLFALLPSCAPKAQAGAAKPSRIAVFVPGVRAGNAIYDTMARGVERAVSEGQGVQVKVFEAGFNQAEWEEKLTSLVATGEYDLIITSNPSMPELCAKVGKSYPKERFICLDGYLKDSPQLHTVAYNQVEQGYLAGYLAGLVSLGGMKGSNPDKKVGMVIGQHYPVMDKVIVPGFTKGLQAADPAFTLDLRVVGDWFDAAKAQALAKDQIGSGADVILPVCGGAAQGVYKASKEAGTHVVVFDDNQFAQAPGVVVGCAVLRQEDLAYSLTKQALEGKLAWGVAEVVGMREGYVAFLDTAPEYLSLVPEAIRAKVATAYADIKAGRLVLELPLGEL